MKVRSFLSRLTSEPWPEECVDWPFAKYRDGYGCLRWEGRTQSAPRVVCRIAHGPSPDGAEVRHLCPTLNRACVNPRHLRCGTRSENQMDRIGEGSSNRGERHGMNKLTEQQVDEIRRCYVGRGGPSQRSLAAAYGVSHQTIGMITRRSRWAWKEAT